MALKQYQDLLANVRWDAKYHSVRQLVQPNDPGIQRLADTLVQHGDFVSNCQNLVNNYTEYTDEIGDYWSTPKELISEPFGDCDCKSIMLVSLLRNYIDADQVFCVVGIWRHDGKDGGHMWVEVQDKKGNFRIVESTAPSSVKLYGTYMASALFNDKYAFATDYGLKEFDLIPVPLGSEEPTGVEP